MYSPLAPRKADFDMVVDLMVETGVLDKKIAFEEFTDTRFADTASIQTAWKGRTGRRRCEIRSDMDRRGFLCRLTAAVPPCARSGVVLRPRRV